MIIKKVILFLYCLIGFSSCVLSQDVSPLFPCSTRLEAPYGAVCHFTSIYRDFPLLDREVDMLKKAEIKNARIDYWLDYGQNNIFKDTLISIMDITTKKMRKSSIDILPIIFVGNKGARPWDYRHNFILFQNHLLSNYNKDFKYLEVMNEVNYISSIEDITQDSLVRLYTEILSETYYAVKEYSPNAKVLSSGLAGTADRFLESLSEHQAFKYFDILNVHSYNKPEDLPNMFKYIKSVMNKYNWEKPLWLSECGMSTYIDSLKVIEPNDIPKIIKRNEYEQAIRLPRIYIISFAYGIDKIYWYEMRSRERDIFDKEENFGLLHADLSPKPAYYSYKTLIQMCPEGSTRPTLSINDNIYMSSWQKPNGENVWAIWSKSDGQPIDLKVNGAAKYYNHLGGITHVPNTVGGGMIYIVGAKSVIVKM